MAERMRGCTDAGGVRLIHDAAIAPTIAATMLTLTWVVTSAPSWNAAALDATWTMSRMRSSAKATHRFRN